MWLKTFQRIARGSCETAHCTRTLRIIHARIQFVPWGTRWTHHDLHCVQDAGECVAPDLVPLDHQSANGKDPHHAYDDTRQHSPDDAWGTTTMRKCSISKWNKKNETFLLNSLFYLNQQRMFNLISFVVFIVCNLYVYPVTALCDSAFCILSRA
mgnify:CR=1 FL=1